MPKNACDEPIALTEREQQIMQTMFEDFEFTNSPDVRVTRLLCTETEYNELRSKFF